MKLKNQKKRIKLNIKLFHMIRVRLISAFMVPVSLIIILGIASFAKASNGIISNYEESASHALEMAGKYLELGIKSVQAVSNQYCNDDSIKKYLYGLYDANPIEKSTKLTEIANSLNTKKISDEFIGNIYIFSKDSKPISTVSKLDNSIYEAFLSTELGKDLYENKAKQYWIASNAILDEKLKTSPEEYAMRLVRSIPGTDAFFAIDIELDTMQEVLNDFEIDSGSILRIITSDGKEIVPDVSMENPKTEEKHTEMIFTDQLFYQDAVNDDSVHDTKVVKYNDQDFVFMYAKIGSTGAMLCELVPYNTITKQADSIKNLTRVIVLLSVVIAIGIGTIIAGGIAKTINKIIQNLRVAAKGDLTVDFSIKRSDEFKQLIEEIQKTFSNMKELILQVKNSSNEVAVSSDSVSKSSNQFVMSSKKISSAMNEIELGIHQQAKDAEECLNQMENLSNKINLVTENTIEINRIADNAKDLAKQGTLTTEELNMRTEETAEIASGIIEEIQALESKSSSIGNIINVINDIANQTNLLSLNASIEAARAGEAGRGFAVVASQIRELADQSKESVNNIRLIIEGIQSDTLIASETARKVEEAMQMQKSAVSNTTESYKNINNSVEGLVLNLKQISENVNNIEKARESTLGAIESISAVLEGIAASSNNVNQSANEQLDSAGLLNSSANNLKNNSTILNEEISKFNV